MRVVEEVHDMLRPARNNDECGRLLEEAALPKQLLLSLLLGEHRCRSLRANHEHPADATRSRTVIDGPIAVGPIHVLPPAIASDGNERILVPGRSPAGHHLLNLGSDDVPDLVPHLAAPTAQRARMSLRSDRLTVGVIVKAEQLRSPPDIHRVAGVQQQPNGGAQRLRPFLRRAERMVGPVEGAHARTHFAAAFEELDLRRSPHDQDLTEVVDRWGILRRLPLGAKRSRESCSLSLGAPRDSALEPAANVFLNSL